MNKYAQHYLNTYISKRATELEDAAALEREVVARGGVPYRAADQLSPKPPTPYPSSRSGAAEAIIARQKGLEDAARLAKAKAKAEAKPKETAPAAAPVSAATSDSQSDSLKQGALNYLSYFAKMAANGSDDLNDTANSNTSKQMGYSSPMTAKDRAGLDKETQRIAKEDIKLNPAPKAPVAPKAPTTPVPVAPKTPATPSMLNKKSALNSIAQFN